MSSLFALVREIVISPRATEVIHNRESIKECIITLWRATEEIGVSIDHVQKENIPKSGKVENGTKKEHAVTSNFGILPGLITTRKSISIETLLTFFPNAQERRHLEKMVANIDIRLVEALLWEKINNISAPITRSPSEEKLEQKIKSDKRSKEEQFLEISTSMYWDYIKHLFNLPPSQVASLPSLVARYQHYSSIPMDALKKEDSGMSIDEFIKLLLIAGEKMAKGMGIVKMPEEYYSLNVEYIQKSVALYLHQHNTMYINQSLTTKNPMELFYVIIHEFGHHLYHRLVDILSNGGIHTQTTNNGYDFTVSLDEGYAILLSEAVIEHLEEAGAPGKMISSLQQIHQFYLYQFAYRAYTSHMVGTGQWDFETYSKAMASLGMDEERIKLEYNNLIANLGYKEAYIIAYEILRELFGSGREINKDKLKEALAQGLLSIDELVEYMNMLGEEEEKSSETKESSAEEAKAA